MHSPVMRVRVYTRGSLINRTKLAERNIDRNLLRCYQFFFLFFFLFFLIQHPLNHFLRVFFFWFIPYLGINRDLTESLNRGQLVKTEIYVIRRFVDKMRGFSRFLREGKIVRGSWRRLKGQCWINCGRKLQFYFFY